MAVFACSDLHGNLQIYEELKRRLRADDKVYVIGDVIDRGNHGWTILRDMLQDERFIVLMGNHESMMLEALKEDFFANWMYNGGMTTYEEILHAFPDHNYTPIITTIGRLPIYANYINADGFNYHLIHSGRVVPGVNGQSARYNEYEALWNRRHFLDEWRYGDQDYIIHGHTPNQHIAHQIGVSYKEGALWYCRGHKCGLDYYTIKTNAMILLNLDTYQQQIITV